MRNILSYAPVQFLAGAASIFVFVSGCSTAPGIDDLYSKDLGQEKITLAYYSDYFSFTGVGDNGLVAFAVDNNRGVDGDRYQTEIFSVLYTEDKGWQKISGQGIVNNNSRQLDTPPGTPDFAFSGNAADGFLIASPANNIKLQIEPIQKTIFNEKGFARTWMGGANAVLEINGTKVTGRVIYEYLYLPNFNRITRTYPGFFKDFHGFYLYSDTFGDFYMHDQKSPVMIPLAGEMIGFLGESSDDQFVLTDIRVVKKSFAWGFYRWPVKWEGAFKYNGEKYSFELELSHRNTISNWIIGGFSMGIIKGKIIRESTGRAFPVQGLGELII